MVLRISYRLQTCFYITLNRQNQSIEICKESLSPNIAFKTYRQVVSVKFLVSKVMDQEGLNCLLIILINWVPSNAESTSVFLITLKLCWLLTFDLGEFTDRSVDPWHQVFRDLYILRSHLDIGSRNSELLGASLKSFYHCS